MNLFTEIIESIEKCEVILTGIKADIEAELGDLMTETIDESDANSTSKVTEVDDIFGGM